MLWANAQVAHLLSVQRTTATVENSQTEGKSNLSEYNEVVVTKNMETMLYPLKQRRFTLGEN